MSFNSATVSASATPALDLMTALHTELNAHAGWTYIEEVTSGTIKARIYRCNAATNTHGADFYVGLRRAADTSLSVQVFTFELWTTGGTGTTSFPVTTNAIAGASNTPDASGRYAGATSTGILSANCLVGNLQVNTTSFYWNCSVSNDRAVFSTLSSGSSGGVYCGAYERLYSSVIDPAPVCMVSPFAQQTNTGGSGVSMFTRELAPFVALSNQWKGYAQRASNVLGPWTDTVSVDLTTGFYVANKILVGGATVATRASARGTLRDVVYTQPGIVPTVGDTATISGATWTCCGASVWVRNAA